MARVRWARAVRSSVRRVARVARAAARGGRSRRRAAAAALRAAWIAATRSLFFILAVLMPRPPAICCSSGSSIDDSEPRLVARPVPAPPASAAGCGRLPARRRQAGSARGCRSRGSDPSEGVVGARGCADDRCRRIDRAVRADPGVRPRGRDGVESQPSRCRNRVGPRIGRSCGGVALAGMPGRGSASSSGLTSTSLDARLTPATPEAAGVFPAARPGSARWCQAFAGVDPRRRRRRRQAPKPTSARAQRPRTASASTSPRAGTSTVGPAPETTAGSPPRAAASAGASCRPWPAPGRPGAAGPRSRRTGLAGSRSARRRAARPGRRRTRRRRAGRSGGSSPRASSVEAVNGGTSTTGSRAGSDVAADRAGRSVGPIQAMVSPPSRQGATLSGWPSMRAGQGQQRRVVRAAASPSVTRPRASTRPATIAAAEDPSPRLCGMRLAQSGAARAA